MRLVELWGETFCQLMAAAEPRRTVLQVDNGRIVVAKDSKIHITAEYFSDSDMGSSWAFLDPEHARGMSLRQLSNTKGERMSTVWAPNGTATMQLRCSDTPMFKTCLRSLKTCSVTWVAPDSPTKVEPNVSSSVNTPGSPQPEDIQVIAHGVWLTNVKSTNPVYTQCKHCRTKIDDEGHCKHSSKHTPEPDSSKAALCSVRLSDFGAAIDDILAEAESLYALGGVDNVDD